MAQRTIKTLGKTGRLSRPKVLSILKNLQKQEKANGAHQSNGTNGRLAPSDTASGQGLIQFRVHALFEKQAVFSNPS